MDERAAVRDIEFVSDGGQWSPLVESKLLRVLAIATENRLANRADVPTFAECGYKIVAPSLYGIVGPKGLPAAAVDALHAAFRVAMADSRIEARLSKYWQTSWYKSPAEYRAYAESHYVEVQPVLTKAGLLPPAHIFGHIGGRADCRSG